MMIVVVSGPAGSGKSTLSKHLSDEHPEWVYLEADRVYPVIPADTDPNSWRRRKVLLTFHDTVTAWAAAGFTVVLDGSLPSHDEELRQSCLDRITPFGLFHVRLHLSEDAWALRNPDATDAQRKWHRAQSEYAARRKETPQLCLDVSMGTPRELAGKIECAFYN